MAMGFVNGVILLLAVSSAIIYSPTVAKRRVTRISQAGFNEEEGNSRFKSTEAHDDLNKGKDSDLEDDVASSNVLNVNTTVSTFSTESTLIDSSESKLLMAALEGDVSTLEQIFARNISRSAVLRSRDPLGNTALHLAVKSGSRETVELLLENGALYSVRGPHLQTPLHMASAAGHAGIVEVLLRRIPRFFSFYHIESLRDTGRSTPLTNALDIVGNTPLTTAVIAGHVDVVRILAPMSDGDTVCDNIITATVTQNMDILDVLLANDNCKDSKRMKQALELAWDADSVWSLIDVIGILTPHDLSSALLKASDDGRVGALRPFIAAGGSISLDWLRAAIEKKQVGVLKELVGIEANPLFNNVLTEDMRSYIKAKMIQSAKNCDVDVLKMLIEAGVDVNSILDGETPLIAAVKGRCEICVSLLLEYEADPNLNVRVVENDGSEMINVYSPLSIADQNEDTEMATILINYGANPLSF